MGLALSEEKTTLTHWRYPVHFLGYQLHGKPTKRHQYRTILSIHAKQLQGIKEALRVVSSYHHIPEIDAITQMSTRISTVRVTHSNHKHHSQSRNSPSIHGGAMPTMSAPKHRLSIARMLKQEQQAGRYGEVRRSGQEAAHLPHLR